MIPAKPRILLAMITVGNGHKAPADAIKLGLEQLYPNQFEIEVLDFTAEVGDLAFDKKHKNSWNWMLKYPQIAYWGQVFIDTLVPHKATRFVQGKLLAAHARNAARYISEKKYDLVVATHFFTIQAVAIAKSKFGIQVPLVGIDVDPFDAHVLWAEERANMMLVASELAREKLIQKGVPGDKIKVLGYPVGLKFLETTTSQQEARRQLGLADLLTVLHSEGGEGIGRKPEEFVEAILETNLPIQYVVICGRNSALLERLTRLQNRFPKSHCNLILQGFTDSMPMWMKASDLVVGKAGAATTMESLFMGRPIFHTSYVAYNDKANLDWCVRQGIGRYVPQPSYLIDALRSYLEQPQELKKLQEKVQNLGVKPGTLKIAQYLVENHL
ncbi:MAG: MGDG synthase family glycosyltransferase [Deinococcales bacterium]